MGKHASFQELLQDTPVIAAVKNDEGLEQALASGCGVIFFLYGTILTIPALVQKAKEAGKMVFVHVDLVDGLTSRDIAADFLAASTAADGVISTRPNLIHRAKELNLITIQRFFLLDSLSFENILRQSSHADAVDILPGTMPKVIERLTKQLRLPLIASGLISDKQDIIAAQSAGAMAVSSTSTPLWFV